MSNKLKSEYFKKIYNARNEMFSVYYISLNNVEYSEYIKKLQLYCFELTGINFNLISKDEIRSAISKIEKVRKLQIESQLRMNLECIDFKKSHNEFVSSIRNFQALRVIDNYNQCSDYKVATGMVASELESSGNRYVKHYMNLTNGEGETLNVLLTMTNAKMSSSALCKVIKDIKRRLTRLLHST